MAAYGYSATDVNSFLNWLCKAAAMSAAPTGHYLQLHTTAGTPGPNGTENVSATTTRMPVNYGTVTDGQVTQSGAVTWPTMTATETLGSVSLWDAATGGTFHASMQMSPPASVIAGQPFTLNTTSLSMGPVAA